MLYNVNPADNALFAAIAGAYARSGVAGLVQWGPAWWFNDTIDGIRRQLDDLGQIGQIGGFIGMLTDSRSLLSMTRHELFRRIFCDCARTRRRSRAHPRGSGDARDTRARRVGRERPSVLRLPRAMSDAAPILAVGGREHRLSDLDVESHLRDLFDDAVFDGETGRRILLVPPDHTRLHSGAGRITGFLFQHLTAMGCDVWVIPALGTHVAMTAAELSSMFSDRVPADRVLEHRWTDGMEHLGEIDGIPVEVDPVLVQPWDLVVSIGQVVPHEVIGMANFTKNLVIGLGGPPTINLTHFLSAQCGIEDVIGRVETPVRTVVDAAFDRFVADRARVMWILTVMESTADEVVQRGLFVGRGRSDESGGAAFRAAADLAAACNICLVDEPLTRVVCWLDPAEFHSTWLGNKAIYRTRMALADGAELVVLAPGVSRFGEDPQVDALIRRHGYRGTAATTDALAADPELAASLGAAAHLVHGSSEGRFEVVYCTDPANGGLSRDEIESVGFSWRPLATELANLDRARDASFFIDKPALGLWASRDRFTRR